MTTLERIPPQSMEAEQAALGAMLLERDSIMKAIGILAREDFYRETHRIIFDGIVALHNKREPVDLVTLGKWLKDKGELEKVGGTLYLTTMMTQVPTAAGIAHYAGIIRGTALQREMIKAADEIQEAAYRGEKDLDEIQAEAETKILRIGDRQRRVTSGKPKTLGEHAADFLNRLEYFMEHRDEYVSIDSPWRMLNAILIPIMPSDLVFIAARPAMGKTTFGLQWARYLSESGKVGALASLEMSSRSLASRAVLNGSAFTMRDIQDQNRWDVCGDDLLIDLANRIDALYTMPLYVDDTPGQTVRGIERFCNAVKREAKRLDYVMVDYIGMIEADGKKSYGQRHNDVSAIAHDLKNIAKRLNVPVFCLAQLNRDVEKEEPKRPQMRHLAESAGIERVADLILGMYRPGSYGMDEIKRAGLDPAIPYHHMVTEIIPLKYRNGAVGNRTMLIMGGGTFDFRDPDEAEWASITGNS